MSRSRSRSRSRGYQRGEPFSPLALGSSLKLWLRDDRGLTLGATPLATGTAPPVVTIATTDGVNPYGFTSLRIEITTTGARGTADFRWSTDDGATYQATAVLTAATVALAGMNCTITFPVGAYTNDNVYRSKVLTEADQSASAANPTQATVARQPLMIPAGMTFDGTDDRLIAIVKTALRPMHDGTGVLVLVSAKVTAAGAFNTLLDSCDLTNTNIGVFFHQDTTNGKIQMLIANGGAGYVANVASDNASVSANVMHVMGYTYDEAATPEVALRSDGVSIKTGTTAVAPSAADATGFLNLMSRTSGSTFAAGILREVVVVSPIPNATDLQLLERYMGRYAGVTIP